MSKLKIIHDTIIVRDTIVEVIHDTVQVNDTVMVQLLENDNSGILNWDWTAIGTLIIAVVSLLYAIRSGNRNAKQNADTLEATVANNKLSVKPYLQMLQKSDLNKSFYSIILINNGFGPAKINSFKIFYDHKTFTNMKEFYDLKMSNTLKEMISLRPKEMGLQSNLNLFTPSVLINNNEQIQIIEFYLSVPISKDIFEDFVSKFSKNFEIEIKYESMYGVKDTLKVKEFDKKLPTNKKV